MDELRTLKKFRTLPTVDELNSRLNYDPETGMLTWKNGQNKGQEVGSLGRGKRTFWLGPREERAARVIWKIMTGEDARFDVDCVNKDESDLRWSNLKLRELVPIPKATRKFKPLPSREFLESLFEYSIVTGILSKIGHTDQAGSLNGSGYQVGVRGHGGYMAQRIIWKMVTGVDPENEIDHRNQNNMHNGWHNLRDATTSQNCQNRQNACRKWKDETAHYPRGVQRRGDKWVVKLSKGRRAAVFYRGYDFDEACRISIEKAKELHGEFYCEQT